MRTMREDGARKVTAGMTTIEEVVSITVGDAKVRRQVGKSVPSPVSLPDTAGGTLPKGDTMSYEMNDLLDLMVEQGASDLHLQVGQPRPCGSAAA
jgi:hypothetical protein